MRTLYSLTDEDLARHESARNAIKVARKLLRSTWLPMARMMARNGKLEVELTSGSTSCTDGKKLFIRVPPELGDLPEHDGTCGRRDEDLILTCDHCAILEDVNITVIHEVSHVIFGTFEEVTEFEKLQLIEQAIRIEADSQPSSKRAAKLRARIDAADPRQKQDYLNLSNLVSPYLPFLINVGEDIRVNTLMHRERRGTKVMFEAQTNRIFRDGVKGYDGSYHKWNEMQPNAQAAIGVYCKVGGFRYDHAISEEVAEKLNDVELDRICDLIRDAKSVRQVYRASFPLLETLRRLGFMKAPDEPEDDPAPEPPEESEKSEEGEPGPGGSEENDTPQPPTMPEDNDEPGQPGEGENDGDSDDQQESDESGGGDPDDSDDNSGDSGSGDSDVDENDDSANEANGPGNAESGDQAEGGAPSAPEDQSSKESDKSPAPEEGEVDEPGDTSADGSDPGEGEAEVPGEDHSGDSEQSDDSDGDSGAGESEEESGTGDGTENSDEPADSGDDGESQSSKEGGSDSSDKSSGEDASSSKGDSDDLTGEFPSGDSDHEDGGSPAEPGQQEPASPSDSRQDGPQEDGPQSGTEDPPAGPQNADKDTDGADDESAPDEPFGEEPAPYTQDDMERDGTPDDIEELMKVFGRHTEATPSEKVEQSMIEDAIERTLRQIDFFDHPSLNIEGVQVHRHEEGHRAWGGKRQVSAKDAVPVPERILVQSLQRLRLVFQDNARGRKDSNLRSGKVNARVLARRVPVGDDRLFKKNHQPGRKDYFVLIGLDCSGSTCDRTTYGVRLDLMKAAAKAKAEMLSRLGVTFAVYAHSGSHDGLDMFEIKRPDEPWGRKQKVALDDLQPYSANLDGHSLEFYRKVAERRPETDKLILYYTDGAMPLANFDEELEILQREIKTCERLRIHLVGVGVNSDSPIEHGLDTILLDDVEDIGKVVKELKARMM